jgi:hypothetical protein
MVRRADACLDESGVRLGLAKAGDAIAGFPMPALFKDFKALKPFEHIALSTQSGCCSKTPML